MKTTIALIVVACAALFTCETRGMDWQEPPSLSGALWDNFTAIAQSIEAARVQLDQGAENIQLDKMRVLVLIILRGNPWVGIIDPRHPTPSHEQLELNRLHERVAAFLYAPQHNVGMPIPFNLIQVDDAEDEQDIRPGIGLGISQ